MLLGEEGEITKMLLETLKLIEYLEALLGKKVDLITKDGVETIRIPYIKESIKRGLIYA